MLERKNSETYYASDFHLKTVHAGYFHHLDAFLTSLYKSVSLLKY